MKKLLSIMLAVMLVMSILPVLPAMADGATATSFTMANGWLNNNGGTATVSGNTLTMVKDGSGAFTYLFYLDSMKNDTSDQDYTINFNAIVSSSRHYANNWDSYEIGFMRMGGDWGTQGFIAIDSDGYDTAQKLYTGFGGSDVTTLTQEVHNYSVITNRYTGLYSVYVDGVAVITDASFDMGEYNTNFNIAVKNANNDATNATLTLTDMVIYEGAYVPAAATEEPTAEPTEEVTEDPNATAAPTKIRDINLSGYYWNGHNGAEPTVTDGVMTMVKDATGSNYNVILWSDTEDARMDTTTIAFDAKISGGLGHSWDGYAVSLYRTDYGNRELVRLVPTATGVNITRGAGEATIATLEGTGYHAYSCVYNKTNDTLEVYADGTKVIDTTLNFTGKTQHGFMVQSGHKDATGCTLKIADVDTYEGVYVRSAAGTYAEATEAPTEEVTEEPTEAPTQAPSGATVTGTIAIDTTKYTVTATANGEPVDITVAANGDYTITLPAAGNYTIVIDAETMVDYSFPVTEQDGTAIEGPSITPILGDYNNDGNITSYDVGQVMGKLAASGANFNAFMDFNNDTNITSYDVGQIMGKVGASY